MPTESFPIAPTVLSVPLHSYGMLAYQLETSGLRSKRECDLLKARVRFREPHFEDGDLLLLLLHFKFRDLKFQRFEIAELRSQIPKLRYVV